MGAMKPVASQPAMPRDEDHRARQRYAAQPGVAPNRSLAVRARSGLTLGVIVVILGCIVALAALLLVAVVAALATVAIS
jgi:hypothetical protein